MSHVTNFILKIGVCEDQGVIEQVNQFDKRQKFPLQPNQECGGTKCLEQHLYLAAFNYICAMELVDHLRTKVDWKYPEEVQLFVCGQHEEHFREVKIFKDPTPVKTELRKYLNSVKKRSEQHKKDMEMMRKEASDSLTMAVLTRSATIDEVTRAFIEDLERILDGNS